MYHDFPCRMFILVYEQLSGTSWFGHKRAVGSLKWYVGNTLGYLAEIYDTGIVDGGGDVDNVTRRLFSEWQEINNDELNNSKAHWNKVTDFFMARMN